MKRGRGEDKVAGPLFPRLHVDDADGGHLRAPPRNKMALYELFSIPSQRSSSDAGGALPRQLHQARSSVPSAFSGQSRGLERSVSSPFCEPHTPAQKVHPHSVGGVNQNTKSTCQERKSSKQHGFHRMATSAANEQMGVNCSSLHPDDLSIVKCPFEKKSGEEDDFRVPTSVQHGNVLHSNKDHRSTGREGTTHSHLHSPQKSGATAHSRSQVQSSHSVHLDRDGSYSLMSQQCENSDKGQAKRTVGLQKDMDDSLSPSMREKAVNQLKIHRTSSNEEHPTFIQNELNTLQGGSVKLSQESHGCSFREARCLNDGEFKEKQVISNEQTESCSKISLDKSLLEPYVTECDKLAGEMVGEAECVDGTSPDDAGNIDPLGNSNKNQVLEDTSRNDGAFETSMVDSISGAEIHPNDVVGLIRPKHFWKARRAIAKLVYSGGIAVRPNNSF